MSCETNLNKNARAAVRNGIARLASKKTFYVGLAVGAVGLALGGLVVIPRLGRRFFARRTKPGSDAPVNARSVAILPARVAVMPTETGKLTGVCATCGSSPGEWYVIGERPHCQDCAPRAARAAAVTLGVPSSSSPAADSPPAEPDNFIPGWRVKVSLVQGRVRVRVVADDDPVGQWHFHDHAYLVLGGDGQPALGSPGATGMAITPTVEVLRDSSGDPVRDERGRATLKSNNYTWYLTHVGSGTAIAGPFKNVAQAQGLASILAQLDWNRPTLSSFSPRERAHIRRTVADYAPGGGALGMATGYRPADLVYRPAARSQKAGSSG
jgi:hypothetical protein